MSGRERLLQAEERAREEGRDRSVQVCPLLGNCLVRLEQGVQGWKGGKASGRASTCSEKPLNASAILTWVFLLWRREGRETRSQVVSDLSPA